MILAMLMNDRREVVFMPDGVIEVSARSLRMSYGQNSTHFQVTKHQDSPGNPAITGSDYNNRGTTWGEGDLDTRPEQRSSMFMSTGLSVPLQR